MDTITRTARILDNDPCLHGLFVPPEAVWNSDLIRLNTPPPTLQTISILSHKIFTDFANIPFPCPARYLVRWHPTRVVFVVLLSAVTLILFPTLLFVPRVATFWGNEI